LLTERDVRELLALKTENKNLDYKQSMNWGTATAEQKGAVVKDVLAMANAQDGGRIIFGVRDGDFEAVGLTEEEFESFDPTRFADFLHRYADPPYACEIHKFVIDDKRFVAIAVPEFSDVPIICKADLNDATNRQVLKRGATYVRTDRAASEVVSTSVAMRDLMNRAVVKRGDQLLKMVERLIKGKPVHLDEESATEIRAEIADADRFILEHLPGEFREVGHWEVEFYVLPYMRERIAQLGSIPPLLTECQVTLRGWYFPHVERERTSNFARGVQSYTVTQHLPRRYLEGYRAYQSGLFVWKSQYWEDTAANVPSGQKALSFTGVIFGITEYFLFAKRYYEKVAPDSTVHLTVRLTDTQNRTLASFDPAVSLNVYVCQERQVQVGIECTVAELVASYEELARKAIRRVYELFNWNDSSDEMMKYWQERLLNRRL
jgi:hypothetical protein